MIHMQRNFLRPLFGAALLLAAMLALAGCKVATPFRGPASEGGRDQGGETVVLALTQVRLGDDPVSNGVFWTHTGRVLDAVSRQPGYLGHSVRRELFGSEAWTMTVWRDESSLSGFVRSEVHQNAIRNGYGAIADVRFANVRIRRSEIPVTWENAERILREQGRSY